MIVSFGNPCTTITSELTLLICEGEQFEGFSQSGVYTNSFISSSGCETVRTLALNVMPKPITNKQGIICAGETFLGYSEAGTYEDRFAVANGCDSIGVIQLGIR